MPRFSPLHPTTIVHSPCPLFSICSTTVFFAAIAAIGFASISNPKRSTFWSLGLLAALGHVTRFILMHYFDVHIALASFAGGLIIGIVSIPMSTVVNSPAETLSSLRCSPWCRENLPTVRYKRSWNA